MTKQVLIFNLINNFLNLIIIFTVYLAGENVSIATKGVFIGVCAIVGFFC